ncbi:GNAT family N-acetyltransferase [Mesobacillus subterraneus]|uniref:GNAT family N-acetyltransferase n=1 Tax=Mesobacillus subterraneus TaxID=285983 RepID=A0A427TX59_9BACI|nr:GNAT family N-acetyltransferase [Mesobacillus subterraneus]RSD29068.1 GNAT family N-acetyltransferase [Mesobacillus subterraneus]
MNIEIKSIDEKPIKASELLELYHNAGWWPERTEYDLAEMLSKTVSVGAWKDGNLIGFARAVTDGEFRAYIEDVVIHSSFQKGGTGTELISRLLEGLTHIDVISLFCEESLIPFYEKNDSKYSKAQYVMHRKQES